MELRQLAYFVAVAEELHFTRAAARLHMAQPPLSQQIKRLERELGVDLFVRVGRGVELSDAGKVFLDEARKVLLTASDALTSVQKAAQGEFGSLTIGYTPSIGLDLLSHAVSIHRRSFPQVEISLQEANTAAQISHLIEGRLHVGLLREKSLDRRLSVQVLRRDPLIVALPESHPLAKQTKIALKQLASEKFILSPPHQSMSYAEIVLSATARAGYSPRVVQQSSETLTTLALVAAGIGISLLPAPIQRVRSRGVVYRPLSGRPPTVELSIAWSKARSSQLIEAFVKTCVQTVSEEAQEGPEVISK